MRQCCKRAMLMKGICSRPFQQSDSLTCKEECLIFMKIYLADKGKATSSSVSQALKTFSLFNDARMDRLALCSLGILVSNLPALHPVKTYIPDSFVKDCVQTIVQLALQHTLCSTCKIHARYMPQSVVSPFELDVPRPSRTPTYASPYPTPTHASQTLSEHPLPTDILPSPPQTHPSPSPSSPPPPP